MRPGLGGSSILWYSKKEQLRRGPEIGRGNQERLINVKEGSCLRSFYYLGASAALSKTRVVYKDPVFDDCRFSGISLRLPDGSCAELRL